METHTGSQFVRDLENIPQVSAIGGWRCCRIDSNRTTRHTGCRFARHLETHTGSQFVRDLENIPQVSVKGGCRSCQIDTIQLDSNDSSPQMTTRHTGCNLHPVWRIVICCDESFDLSRIVSNRQHLLHCIVYNILTIDFRSSHALRRWKVHVVTFSYHATHFHSLLTCAPLDFRYVKARFDFQCDDSSRTVD